MSAELCYGSDPKRVVKISFSHCHGDNILLRAFLCLAARTEALVQPVCASQGGNVSGSIGEPPRLLRNRCAPANCASAW